MKEKRTPSAFAQRVEAGVRHRFLLLSDCVSLSASAECARLTLQFAQICIASHAIRAAAK